MHVSVSVWGCLRVCRDNQASVKGCTSNIRVKRQRYQRNRRTNRQRKKQAPTNFIRRAILCEDASNTAGTSSKSHFLSKQIYNKVFLSGPLHVLQQTTSMSTLISCRPSYESSSLFSVMSIIDCLSGPTPRFITKFFQTKETLSRLK